MADALRTLALIVGVLCIGGLALFSRFNPDALIVQYRNKQIALELLKSRLQQRAESAISSSRAADRNQMSGLGERGDKSRTIRL